MSITAASSRAASAGSRTGVPAEQAAPAGMAAGCAEAAWLALLLAAPLAMNRVAPRVFEAAKLTALAPLAGLLVAACIAVLLQRYFSGRKAMVDGVGGAAGALGPDGAAAALGVLPGGVTGPGAPPASFAPPRALLFSFAALFACALVATLASEMPGVAWIGSYLRREGLAGWLIAGAPAAAMLLLLRERAQLDRAIDALLLAGLLPCLYALMQRYGAVVDAMGQALPLLRPGGTLGNPVFLGDCLMLLVPLTLARVLSQPAWRARAPWLLLLGSQIWVLLLTQSRAPMGALAVALWLFALLYAGMARSRGWLLAGCGLLAAAVLAPAAFNVVPALREVAMQTPGMQRLLLGAADPSTASRVGVWQAGWDALAHAPLGRLLFGHGFDVAYQHYYAHLPPSVLRIEGEFDLPDRLHNEALELVAGIGLLGLGACMAWLGVLLRMARDAVAAHCDVQAAGRGLRWAFVLAPWGVGLLALGAMLALGQRALAGPAFGLGAGLVWGALLLMPVLRAGWRARERRALTQTEVLLAALAATVPGFWLDAQLSLPVMGTRALFFALAALLALVAARCMADAARGGVPAVSGPGRGVTGRDASQPDVSPQASARDGVWPGWMAAVLVAVALVAFVPAPSGTAGGVSAPAGWAQALLLAAPLVMAALMQWARGVDRTGAAGGWRALGLTAGLCVAGAVLGYVALGLVSGAPEFVLAAPVLWVWVWLPLACVGLAAWLGRAPVAAVAEAPVQPKRKGRAQVARPVAPRPTGGVRWGLAGVFALAPLAVAFTFSLGELRADTLARLAGQAWDRNDFSTAQAYAREAMQMRPNEPRYVATLAGWRLEYVIAQLRKARGGKAEDFMFLADELRTAEGEMRAALALAPDDPWRVLGLANALQLKGMTATRPLLGPEGAQAAQEAKRLFARARQLYPAQPLVLRNWAQLEFDGGDVQSAYRLLDEMELLLPQGEEPYLERWRMARFAGDAALAQATLRRARERLPDAALQRLEQALAREP